MTMIHKTAIVIGGGIAGCSTAYALAQRGLQVTLVERNAAIASEASGNPLGMLYPRLSGDDASSAFALAGFLYSLSLYRSLDLPATDFSECGMLQLGFNERELSRIRKVASQHYPEHIVRFVEQAEASQLANIKLAHDALYFPHGAWLKPQHICKRLTQHSNIKVITSQQVTAIIRNESGFDLYAHEHQLASANIVVIANAHDAQRLCPDLPLDYQAVRGQVSLMQATSLSEPLSTIVCSDGYFSPAAYQQDKNQLHCLGATFATESATESASKSLSESGLRAAEMLPQEKDHLANLQKLHNISPQLHDALHQNIVGGRVSLRCSSTDYWPLAGQLLDGTKLRAKPPRAAAPVEALPWVSGSYMNIAHGSKGFTSAPLCAELIASIICHEPLPLADELAGLLNPNRFLLRDMGLKRLAKMTINYT